MKLSHIVPVLVLELVNSQNTPLPAPNADLGDDTNVDIHDGNLIVSTVDDWAIECNAESVDPFPIMATFTINEGTMSSQIYEDKVTVGVCDTLADAANQRIEIEARSACTTIVDGTTSYCQYTQVVKFKPECLDHKGQPGQTGDGSWTTNVFGNGYHKHDEISFYFTVNEGESDLSGLYGTVINRFIGTAECRLSKVVQLDMTIGQIGVTEQIISDERRNDVFNFVMKFNKFPSAYDSFANNKWVDPEPTDTFSWTGLSEAMLKRDFYTNADANSPTRFYSGERIFFSIEPEVPGEFSFGNTDDTEYQYSINQCQLRGYNDAAYTTEDTDARITFIDKGTGSGTPWNYADSHCSPYDNNETVRQAIGYRMFWLEAERRWVFTYLNFVMYNKAHLWFKMHCEIEYCNASSALTVCNGFGSHVDSSTCMDQLYPSVDHPHHNGVVKASMTTYSTI